MVFVAHRNNTILQSLHRSDPPIPPIHFSYLEKFQPPILHLQKQTIRLYFFHFQNKKKSCTFAAECERENDRGPKSPILLHISMIETEKIRALVAEHIEGSDLFLVDLQISTSNKISVIIDSWTSVTIDDCVALSRKIEGSLDRDEEDFALEISSAGLDHPFAVLDQYKKNRGKNVEVITLDGIKTKGKLLSVNGDGVELEIEKKVKLEGKKKKEIVVEKTSFLLNNIKSTKVEISFK